MKISDFYARIIIFLIIFKTSLIASPILEKLDYDQAVALAKACRSFTLTDNFEKLNGIEGIVLIGSSGAGKTTLVNELKQECPHLAFPQRFITRSLRQNEDLDENISVTKEDFTKMQVQGLLEFSWVRKMDCEREELYGFSNPMKNTFPVYSANNAVLTSDYLAKHPNLLIIGIYAPQEIREQRLLQRSPDITNTERTHRVADPDIDAMKHAHIIVSNYGGFEKFISKFDLVTFVKSIPLMGSKWGCITNLGMSNIEYRSRLFDVVNHTVRFSDGVEKRFQFVRRSPGVRILLLNSNNQALLTREWRTEINAWDFRLPGGKVFETSTQFEQFLQNEQNSNVNSIGKAAAIRELEEECGIQLDPETVRYVYTSKCGATVDWDLLFFIGKLTSPLQHKGFHNSHEGERTVLEWVNLDHMLELCKFGLINEDRTNSFLMRYLLNTQNF
jgi:ADP-ribose pyrophosphatase